MKKLQKFFRKIPSRYLILAMIVAVAVSCITVSGTFASFQTTVIGTGETPVAAWDFQVKINNDFADDTSRISYISLAGDDYKTTIVKGSTEEANLQKLHTYNRDDSSILPDYILAPGTAGYMPVEIDGSAANVSVLVTIKAEFSYTNAFTYYDNLGRELTVTAESETDSVLVHNEDNSRDAEVDAEGKISTTYVGYITYNYYVSYQQIQKWTDGDFIDVGFRWTWAEEDSTATENMPKYIYSRITVTGAQVTNANQIKDSDTVINFVSQSSDFKYGNVLNVVNTTSKASLTAAPSDGDLYVDVNPTSKPEDLKANATDVYMGKASSIAVEPTAAYAGKIILGTTRSQHGYPAIANKASVSFNENVNSTSIQISDDFTYSTLESILNLYVNEAPTMYDALNNVKTTLTTSDDDAVKANANLVKSIYNGGTAITDVASVAKLVSDNSLLWDSQGKVFVAESGVTPSVRYFKAYSAMPATQTYSIYLTGNSLNTAITGLTVGLDVGENTGIASITYDRSSATTAQTAIIRTNSETTNVVVNAPMDIVKHYGICASMMVNAVANESYHEFGIVGFIEVGKGRIALESTADVKMINIAKKDDTSYDIVTIEDNGIVTLPSIISRDQVTVNEAEGIRVVEVISSDNTSEIVKAYPATGVCNSTEKITTGNSKQNETVSTNVGMLVIDSGTNAGEKAYDSATLTAEAQKAVNKVVENNVTPSEEKQILITKDGATSEWKTLVAFRDAVNAGNTFAGYTVTLKTNVDLSSVANWTPIGTSEHPFSGIFDGNNKTISNLTVNLGNGGEGLFGYVIGSEYTLNIASRWNKDAYSFDSSDLSAGFTTAIKNLTVKKSSITTNASVKGTGIIGSAEKTYIYNVKLDNSTVYGCKSVGGILGNMNGVVIENCSTSSDSVIKANTYNVGGIVGVALNAAVNYYSNMGNIIIDCTNNASIIKEGNGGYVGGILASGQNSSASNAFISCVNNGNISVINGEIGGLIGQCYCNGQYVQYCVNCTNNGNIVISGTCTNVGGIANNAKICGVNLVNNGNISGSVSGDMSGILARAANTPTFNACVNNGTLSNNDSNGKIYDICSCSSNLVILGQYASVTALNTYIASQNSDNSVIKDIVLTNITVDSKDTELIIPKNASSFTLKGDSSVCENVVFESDRICPTSVNINNVSVNINNALVKPLYFNGTSNNITVNATAGHISVSGNNSNITVNASMSGSLGLGGKGNVSATIAEGVTVNRVGFDDAGTYTLTNRGTITNATNGGHTVSTISDSTITINNYGSIENHHTNATYTLLFYGKPNVIFNAYEGSVLLTEYANLNLAHSSESLVFNYADGAIINNGGNIITYPQIK